jgi:hypothetical protein
MSNISAQQSPSRTAFWSCRREATLNWLALGLLLAAWNASDNGAAVSARRSDASTSETRRPESLRGYALVSVRAANRITPEIR